MILVGIDTGVDTGFAIYDTKTRKLVEVGSMMIHQAMKCVSDLYKVHKDLDGIKIRVEDARQRKWFGTEKMTREKEREKLQGVGSVKRDSSIWEDFLTDLGVQFEMVAPRYNVTKLKADYFNRITGWHGRSNEHGRDAAGLVFGF
jgi:predicted mannosyl-3-phosphoglycerate phosphatase (HAD superfamily)